MSKIILSEHDAFKRLTDGLDQAADGARMMQAHDPDKAYMWAKVVETFFVLRQSVYKISEERASRVKGSN